MKKLAVLGLAAAMGGFASAGVYDVALGTLTSNGTTFSNYVGNGTIGGVRGAYVSGNWHALNAANQWSNEAQLDIETGVGTGVWASGGTTTAPVIGGQGNSNDFTYGSAGPTWSNGRLSPNNNVIDNFWGTGNYNGAFNVRYRQSFGATQQSQITETVLHLMTDYIAPMSATITANSPTFRRFATLTTQGPVGNYNYTTTNFSLNEAGIYLVGAKYDDGTRHDGYLGLYNGAFDPNSPLTNLIGTDDDGVGGFAAATGGSSVMLLNLAAGNYTMVYTRFDAGAPTSTINVTGFVAGGSNPVPEPGTMIALSLGAAALLRRRRK